MPPSRIVSLTLAVSISLLLLLFPFTLGPRLSRADHIALVILLLGTAGAFVHGFGFTPERKVWRALFSPAVSWPLAAGAGYWFAG
jgi:predicted membrane protein